MEGRVSDRMDGATERLEGLLRRLVGRGPIVQAVVAVESGDRAFRWAGAEGLTAAGRHVTAETPFFIASMDKLYNATIALMLSEGGRLDLDEPITAFLPSTITRGLHRYRGEDLSGRITVRHLLTHTSGLADWLEDYPKGGPSLIEQILAEGDKRLTLEEMVAHVRDHLRPHFPPQDLAGGHPRVRYSDTNYLLVVAIIEAVTGEPLHEVHRRLFHEPLGLRQTGFAGAEARPAPDLMVLRAGGEPLAIPRLIESVRGIYSSAGDMIAFMRALMGGELFRRPETLPTMLGGWHRFGFPRDRGALRAPGWPIEYGTGVMRFRLPRLFSPMAPAPSVLGHTGSTGCWLFYCPELDMFLAGSVDEVTAGAVPFRTVPRILKILREA